MTTYAVFIRDRTLDVGELATYGEKAAAASAGFSAVPLAVYGQLAVLEGPPVEGAVILSFPSMSEALAWYESPAYQEAREHRLKGAEYRAFLIDGLDIPTPD
jgi:uncharacterized protein (DUF1330 family)